MGAEDSACKLGFKRCVFFVHVKFFHPDLPLPFQGFKSHVLVFVLMNAFLAYF